MRILMKLIAYIRSEFMYWRWMMPTMSKHVLGRWYVFRDCPDWFVTRVAHCSLSDFQGDSESVRKSWAFVMEAKKEFVARTNKRLAVVRQQVPELNGEVYIDAEGNIMYTYEGPEDGKDHVRGKLQEVFGDGSC